MASNKSSKLGFNLWLETDPVDFEEINDNFKIIDNLIVCKKHREIISSYTGGTDNTATWDYKEYTDGTMEISAKFEYENLKCNGGTAAPYYSGITEINLPINFTDIKSLQVHLASNTIGWVVDVTNKSVTDSISLRVMSIDKETSNIYKQIFVTVKGTGVLDEEFRELPNV